MGPAARCGSERRLTEASDELAFLQEIGRVVRAARPLTWKRDPIDRLIVGDAVVSEGRLATKDRVIREHCSVSLW